MRSRAHCRLHKQHDVGPTAGVAAAVAAAPAASAAATGSTGSPASSAVAAAATAGGTPSEATSAAEPPVFAAVAAAAVAASVPLTAPAASEAAATAAVVAASAASSVFGGAAATAAAPPALAAAAPPAGAAAACAPSNIVSTAAATAASATACADAAAAAWYTLCDGGPKSAAYPPAGSFPSRNDIEALRAADAPPAVMHPTKGLIYLPPPGSRGLWASEEEELRRLYAPDAIVQVTREHGLVYHRKPFLSHRSPSPPPNVIPWPPQPSAGAAWQPGPCELLDRLETGGGPWAKYIVGRRAETNMLGIPYPVAYPVENRRQIPNTWVCVRPNPVVFLGLGPGTKTATCRSPSSGTLSCRAPGDTWCRATEVDRPPVMLRPDEALEELLRHFYIEHRVDMAAALAPLPIPEVDFLGWPPGGRPRLGMPTFSTDPTRGRQKCTRCPAVFPWACPRTAEKATLRKTTRAQLAHLQQAHDVPQPVKFPPAPATAATQRAAAGWEARYTQNAHGREAPAVFAPTPPGPPWPAPNIDAVALAAAVGAKRAAFGDADRCTAPTTAAPAAAPRGAPTVAADAAADAISGETEADVEEDEEEDEEEQEESKPSACSPQ